MILFVLSPECLTNKAIRRQYASIVGKHLVRAIVGLCACEKKKNVQFKSRIGNCSVI